MLLDKFIISTTGGEGQTYEAKDASGSSHSDGVTKDKGSRGAGQA